jgi:hypothetical protein
MLSIENTSFDVTLEQFNVSDPNVRVAMHFLLPDQHVPLHLRGLTRRTDEHSFPSNTRIFGVITAMDVLQKQAHRLLFVPIFNTVQQHRFQNIVVETLLHTKHQHDQITYDTNASFKSLEKYIQSSLQLLQQTPASDARLKRLHSVYWSFPLSVHGTTLKMYVPYVCLVCRGDVLVNNISKDKWYSIQRFFIQELMTTCKESGMNPSEFMRLSKDAVQNAGNQHKVYLHLANMFSMLVHKHIRYMTDYKATGEKDAVGINSFDGYLYADCEDMAQAAYDLMRVCRKVFPSQKQDLHHGACTFMYHVSAWLNQARLGIIQGAIGKSYDKKLHNHVWACILPYESFPVFVEGTLGVFEPAKYRYAIRFWQRGHDNLRDYLLINPNTSSYGVDCNTFLQQQAIIEFIESNSYKCSTSSVKKDIHFAANLQIDTFNLLNYLINTK